MSDKTIIESRALNLYYGDNHALKDISIQIPANKITALIGAQLPYGGKVCDIGF